MFSAPEQNPQTNFCEEILEFMICKPVFKIVVLKIIL